MEHLLFKFVVKWDRVLLTLNNNSQSQVYWIQDGWTQGSLNPRITKFKMVPRIVESNDCWIKELLIPRIVEFKIVEFKIVMFKDIWIPFESKGCYSRLLDPRAV